MIGRPIKEPRTAVVLRLLQGGVLLLSRELVLVLVAPHGAPHAPVPHGGGHGMQVILLAQVQHEVVVFVVVIRLEWSRT